MALQENLGFQEKEDYRALMDHQGKVDLKENLDISVFQGPLGYQVRPGPKDNQGALAPRGREAFPASRVSRAQLVRLVPKESQD